MTKLIHANFYRLKKSKCFWFLLVLMFLSGIYIYLNFNGFHPERCVNCSNELGSVLFQFGVASYIILPIFTTIFMSPLYGNGIIKNMIIVGHKRTDIYLSNLFTIIIVNLIFALFFLLGTILTSLIFISDITIPINKLIFLIIDLFFLIISYASLFNFIALSFNKISNITVSFITVIWGIITCSNIIGKYETCTSNNLCNIYEFILKVLPIGQGFLISNLTDNYKFLSIYSLIFIFIINYLGIFIINKKQIN